MYEDKKIPGDAPLKKNRIASSKIKIIITRSLKMPRRRQQFADEPKNLGRCDNKRQDVTTMGTLSPGYRRNNR